MAKFRRPAADSSQVDQVAEELGLNGAQPSIMDIIDGAEGEDHLWESGATQSIPEPDPDAG